MPGLVMDYVDFHQKKGSSALSQGPESPKSDSLDLAIDGAIVDTSIDQLYNNVYEMQSSDESPSRASFISYGEESRIDSELRYLVGDFADVEVTKEVVVEKNEEEEEEEEEPVPSLVGKESVKKQPKVRKVLKTRSFRAKPGLKVKSLWPRDHSPNLGGGFLLKQAKDMLISGENPQRTLEVAQRATRAFEEENKDSLERVMCLHVSAISLCNLGRYEEAVPILRQSLEITGAEDSGEEAQALAKFSGSMLLGDTYAMMGQVENSLSLYGSGLEIQSRVLGEKDTRFGETCRHVAEAHLQACSFEEAERLCQRALEIHIENRSGVGRVEEAADRRLMGLICGSRGNHEASLEHYVLASKALASLEGQELGLAFMDRSIGDAFMAISRYDEAYLAYKKALSRFKALRGESRPETASVYVRLGDLLNKLGRIRESNIYCESALEIYMKRRPNGTHESEEISSGLVDLSVIYQSKGEFDRALKLLRRALLSLSDTPGMNQNTVAAGIEAQIGVLCYMMGSFEDSYSNFKSSVSKFRANSSEKKPAFFGVALNQMGLVCVKLYLINEAAELFEEAKDILDKEYGPCHLETLEVYSNLAGTYDAMGRVEDAIETLEYVVGMREEKLGTASADVDDEKRRLAELLKEAGRARNRQSTSLGTLLDKNNDQVVDHDDEIKVI